VLWLWARPIKTAPVRGRNGPTALGGMAEPKAEDRAMPACTIRAEKGSQVAAGGLSRAAEKVTAGGCSSVASLWPSPRPRAAARARGQRLHPGTVPSGRQPRLRSPHRLSPAAGSLAGSRRSHKGAQAWKEEHGLYFIHNGSLQKAGEEGRAGCLVVTGRKRASPPRSRRKTMAGGPAAP